MYPMLRHAGAGCLHGQALSVASASATLAWLAYHLRTCRYNEDYRETGVGLTRLQSLARWQRGLGGAVKPGQTSVLLILGPESLRAVFLVQDLLQPGQGDIPIPCRFGCIDERPRWWEGGLRLNWRFAVLALNH